jgi:hypothetical protein
MDEDKIFEKSGIQPLSQEQSSKMSALKEIVDALGQYLRDRKRTSGYPKDGSYALELDELADLAVDILRHNSGELPSDITTAIQNELQDRINNFLSPDPEHRSYVIRDDFRESYILLNLVKVAALASALDEEAAYTSTLVVDANDEDVEELTFHNKFGKLVYTHIRSTSDNPEE